MGTHPIFESDFDCLTDVCFVLNQLKMRYVAAYLLAQLGGNDAPDAAAIKAILGSVGVDADEEKMNKVISELSGKAIADFSLKVKKNSPLSHLVVVLPQPLVALLPPVVLLMPQLPKKRRLNHPRAKMKIWDSVFSTKTDTTHTVYVPTLL